MKRPLNDLDKQSLAADTDEGEIAEAISGRLARFFGVRSTEADEEQVFRAVMLTLRDIMSQRLHDFRAQSKKEQKRKVYYLCMEFLVGKGLKNDLMNMGLYDSFSAALTEMGFSLEALCEREREPGLGNGGLGRLAACYMDALTTGGYDATGFSICYEYGYFKQRIIDGNQIELPDAWMDDGSIRLIARTDRAYDVSIGGRVVEKWTPEGLRLTLEDAQTVRAVAYDMLISGANCSAVNRLRLWKAYDTKSFDMKLFSQGEYVRAMQEASNAQILSKLLYPSDDHVEGKLLRLTQQYFLVSASLQNIIFEHLRAYPDLSLFAEKTAIHINDTHPALAIPELMRLLMDEHGFSWEDAWSTVCRCVSYTNHTVLPEALETWKEDLFALRLPRIHAIVCEINRRFCEDLWQNFPGAWERISKMAITASGQVRMANLCLCASHAVNGVSELHSEILKETVFRDFYKFTPEKFGNVTNGIAYRRWLCYSNEGLSALLDDCIGEGYRHDARKLADFAAFADDDAVLCRLGEIKSQNKRRFAEHYQKKTGSVLNPDSLFDVQVKRIHEYKRQLLNVMKIIALYVDLHEGAKVTPATFIFGGKAAPGYYMAKEILRLIWALGKELAADQKCRDVLRVVLLENYNVSESEILMPSAEISEQISLAGKEASGTGCMKFMVNGALTLGTLDGANVEIIRHAGAQNVFTFGMSAAEVDETWRQGYDSSAFLRRSDRLKRVISALRRGFAGISFDGIANYLVSGAGVADPYMCMADFESYFAAYERACDSYADPNKWEKMSLYNIAGGGYFSADRAIAEYADRIWHISPVVNGSDG